MLDELVRRIPTAGDLLSLSPTQLDAALLDVIAQRMNNPDPVAAKYVDRREIQNLYVIGNTQSYQQTQDADAALMESWQRLTAAALIIQASGQLDGMTTLTKKGKAVAGNANFDEINARQKLTRDMLHPDFQGSVYDNFTAGNYDTSVRDAMVLVEDAVRTVAGLTNADYGAGLIKKAFKVGTGKLTDSTISATEQQSVHDLFLGAFGTIRNPVSHRKIGKDDPLAVIEELMLASRLMRFVRP